MKHSQHLLYLAAPATGIAFVAIVATAPTLSRGGAVSFATLTQTFERKNAPAQSGLAEVAVMDLARQNDFNVVIDSTLINATAPAQKVDRTLRLITKNPIDVLTTCAEDFRLSAKNFAPNTLVLWAEPDQKHLAQAALKGEGFGWEPDVHSSDEVLRELRNELDALKLPVETTTAVPVDVRPAYNTGATAEPPLMQLQESGVTVKMSQLSPALQRKLVPFFVQQALYIGSESRYYNELWTRDEVWQRAFVWRKPANPVFHDGAVLVVEVEMEDHQNRLLSYLLPSNGAIGAEVERRRRGGPPVPVSAPLEAGKLRILPKFPVGDLAATTVDDVTQRSGSAWNSYEVANVNRIDWGAEKSLNTPVSLDAMRRPLAEFLLDAGRAAGVALQVDSSLEAAGEQAAPVLASAHVKAMPLALLMQAVAHAYSAHWEKEDAQTFSLKSSGHSAFDRELLRVGNLSWYRFRDISQLARIAKQQESDSFEAGVVERTGDGLTKPPGMTFVSLPADLQKAVRERAMTAMERRVIEQQVKVRNMLSGEWSFRVSNGTLPIAGPSGATWSAPMLMLLVDGKMRSNVSWFASAPAVPKTSKPLAP